MRKQSYRKLVPTLLISGLVLAAASVAAHEPRSVGPKGEYKMVVGWINEPAYAGALNGIDIYLNKADGKAVNTSMGDKVDLQVEVQLRASEAPQAAVVESAPLEEKPALVLNSENRYNAWFKPMRPGVYAFRIRGTISDAANPNASPVAIDETFVCGKGSKQHHAFVCLVDPQVFPAAKRAN